MKKTLIILAGLFFLIGLPLGVYAEREKSIIVASHEKIKDNFVHYADTVIIDGQVDGDVIVGGGQVSINGSVSGDAIIAAGSVNISGDISGNARIVGNTVNIRGAVSKNVTVLAVDKFTLTTDGSVGWSLGFIAGNAEVNGPVYGNITGTSMSLALGSSVGSNVNVRVSGSKLMIGSEAEIDGNLRYTSDEDAVIDSSQVAGIIERRPVDDTYNDFQEMFAGSVYFFRGLSLISLLLVGLVMLTLFPQKTKKVVDDLMDKPFVRIGWGVIYFIGIPIAAIILFISIIGAPLGFISLVLYGMALYVGYIYVGLLIGQKILSLFIKKKTLTPIVPLVLGVTIFYALTWLPVVGFIVGLAGIIWALGSLVRVFYRDIKKNNFAVVDNKK